MSNQGDKARTKRFQSFSTADGKSGDTNTLANQSEVRKNFEMSDNTDKKKKPNEKSTWKKLVCCLIALLVIVILISIGWGSMTITTVRLGLCAIPTIVNPGNSFINEDYYYSGTASLKLIPFTVTPPECTITYECTESLLNLCNFSSETTTSTFDTNSGEFSFNSSDITTFGTQTVSFTITGQAGQSTESITYELNFIDPCSASEIVIDPLIIPNSIDFNIHASNSALVQ